MMWLRNRFLDPKWSSEGSGRSIGVPATHPTTNILLYFLNFIFYLVFAKCKTLQKKKKVIVTVMELVLTNSGSSLVAQVYNFQGT